MDWKSLIAVLQSRGLTQAQIAAECKCGQPSISDLATGKTLEPRFSLGEALLSLLKRTPEPAPAHQAQEG